MSPYDPEPTDEIAHATSIVKVTIAAALMLVAFLNLMTV
jgi:hypothetical protein